MAYTGEQDLRRTIAEHLAEINTKFSAGLRKQTNGAEGLLTINPRTVVPRGGKLFATGRDGHRYMQGCEGREIVRLWAREDGNGANTEDLLREVDEDREGALGKYLKLLNRDIIRYREAGGVTERDIVLGVAAGVEESGKFYDHRDLGVWFKTK
jgi:hypothetical protein